MTWSTSFQDVFLLTAVLVVLAFLLTIFLPGHRSGLLNIVGGRYLTRTAACERK